MNDFQKLCAYLKIVYQNLGILHRNLIKDVAWFANHEQIAKWYDVIGEEADDLIERGLALGYKEPTISEAVLMFQGDLISADKRELKESFMVCLKMFRAVAGMLQAAEKDAPADLINRLQEYGFYWNKEANYKLAQAIEFNRIDEDDD